MKTILRLHTLLTLGCGMLYGPCHDVTTVEVDYKEWEAAGGMYVNVRPTEQDVHCEWVFHYLTYDDRGRVYPSYHLKYMTSESQEGITWSGEHVGRGHYVTTSELIGRNSTIHTYFLYLDPPNLICHFTCTDDPYLKNIKGGLVCESATPYPSDSYASVIWQVAEDNGFDLEDHMIANNCKEKYMCFDYIPFEQMTDNTCKNISIQEYFEL